MNCRKTRSLLSAFYDNELEPILTKQIRGHIKSCARCRKELAALHRLGHQLDQQQPVPDLWPRIETALATPRPQPRRRMVAITAALLLIAAVFLTLDFPTARPVDQHAVDNFLYQQLSMLENNIASDSLNDWDSLLVPADDIIDYLNYIPETHSDDEKTGRKPKLDYRA